VLANGSERGTKFKLKRWTKGRKRIIFSKRGKARNGLDHSIQEHETTECLVQVINAGAKGTGRNQTHS